MRRRDFIVLLGGMDAGWPLAADAQQAGRRVLRGIRPSELPVEQPTRFELVVNLKTAG